MRSKRWLATIFAFFVVLIAVLLGQAAMVAAQKADYPTRQIQLVIDKAPGDVTDLTGRAVADQLSKILNVPVVAINKPGAGGVEGADTVAKARKDGYTLLYSAAPSITSIPVTSPKTVPYDPSRDLEPLARAVSFPLVIAVKADAPWKSLRELVEHARKQPVRIATVGRGTSGDFNVAIINSVAGVNISPVPFKGGAPTVAAVLGGHVEGTSLSLGPTLPQMRAGQFRALVISRKSGLAPEVPTPAEAGYPQMKLLGAWAGTFAPAGLPESVLKVLIPALESAIRAPEVARTTEGVGASVEYQSPEEFRKSIAEETELVRQVAEKAGLIKR